MPEVTLQDESLMLSTDRFIGEGNHQSAYTLNNKQRLHNLIHKR